MNYKVWENIFNWLMVKIRKLLYFILKLDVHERYISDKNVEGYIPLLSYNPKLKTYRFNCYCKDCPVNHGGLCSTQFFTLPFNLMHEWDGDNIIKNYCG